MCEVLQESRAIDECPVTFADVTVLASWARVLYVSLQTIFAPSFVQAAAGIPPRRCTRARLFMHQFMAPQLGRCGKAAPESAETDVGRDHGSG